MAKVLLILSFLLSVSSSCKKEQNDLFVSSREEKYVIKGVHFFNNEGGRAVETVGVTNDTLSADSIELLIFPNPQGTNFSFILNTQRKKDSFLTFSIAHSQYPTAPDSYKIFLSYPDYKATLPVEIENSHLTGKEIIRKTKIIAPPNMGSRGVGDLIYMSDFPRGFYRAFLETNTGARLQVSFYKY